MHGREKVVLNKDANLMECHSLPILQYCVAAIKFTDTQLKALNEAGTWPSVKFLVFIDGSQSKRSYVALGVLILNIYMLLDVLNSGRVSISSNVVLRTVFSCFANSQDFNQLCCSYVIIIIILY